MTHHLALFVWFADESVFLTLRCLRMAQKHVAKSIEEEQKLTMELQIK
jgi:hypothetical protein